MINICTILIITYIINICLLKSINNLSLKESSVFDACLAELATYVPITGDVAQFSEETESGVTTTKFISTDNAFIQKKSTSSDIINHYIPTITDATAEIKYAIVELKNDYIARKEGEASDYTYEMICDNTIPIGDCQKTTIHIGTKEIGDSDPKTPIYVDKCGVTAAYTGSAPSPTPEYNHLSDAKKTLLKSSIINVRMSRTINNKISTTFINSDATKYCHINNINENYMIFVGTFKADVVGTSAGEAGGGPITLSDAAGIKYYEETDSEIKIICGKKAESGSGGNSGGALKNKNSLNSLKAETDECLAKYATFNIESNDDKHYFYMNSFYLGEKSTEKYSIPKSVADGVSSEDQWCFEGLEINKISIININIFIIIIVLLLSLI